MRDRLLKFRPTSPLHRLRVYPLGEDIPRYPVSICVLVQVLQVLQALQVLQVLRVPQAPPSELLQLLQLLPSLQVLPSLPFQLVSAAAVIDCSQSTKKSQETLKLQIPPIISSYIHTSFNFNKTLTLDVKDKNRG